MSREGVRYAVAGEWNMDDVSVAVFATLDSKGPEARFLCDALKRAGGRGNS